MRFDDSTGKRFNGNDNRDDKLAARERDDIPSSIIDTIVRERMIVGIGEAAIAALERGHVGAPGAVC